MNKNILVILLLIFSSNIFGQKIEYPKIGIGVAFRFDPWTLDESKQSTTRFFGSYYPFMDTKTRFSLSVKEKIPGKNNLELSLENYITYVRIGFKSNNLFLPDKRFKRDHLLEISNTFNAKKNSKAHFFLGLGVGYMNLGTKFNYVKLGGNNGQPNIVDSNAIGSQRFFAPSLSFGVKYKSNNAQVKLYGTPDQEGEPYPTIWMEIKFSSDINLFKKK
jgi:hypothetical protein